MTRDLSVNERAALDALLACDFPGVEALRRQASDVRADGEGLVVTLYVLPEMPQASVTSRVPVEATVVDDDGHSNGLLLFVDDGLLSALEYWWTADEMPTGFPDPRLIGPPEPSDG